MSSSVCASAGAWARQVPRTRGAQGQACIADAAGEPRREGPTQNTRNHVLMGICARYRLSRNASGPRVWPRAPSSVLVLVLVVSLLKSPATMASGSVPSCAPPLPGEAPELAEPVEVCRTTILTGTKAGFVRVRLPQETSFSLENQYSANPDVKVEGAGAFVGFALLTSGTSGPDMDAPGVLLGRYPQGAHTDRIVGRLFGDLETWCRPCVFPAGAYLLYLLADQTPVRITIHFSGLSGQVELTPDTEVAFRARMQTIRLQDETRSIYLAGGGGDLYSEGIIWTAVWAAGSINVYQRWAVGLYTFGEPSVYLPQCEGANYQVLYAFNSSNLQPWRDGLDMSWRVSAPGRYGVCDWAALLTGVERAESMAFWWSVRPLTEGSMDARPDSVPERGFQMGVSRDLERLRPVGLQP